MAVSGGVDSIVLLDLLVGQAQLSVYEKKKINTNGSGLATSDTINTLELIVGHFNHGIRADSMEDEKLVREAAKRHGLRFEVGYGELGANASEEKARDARYDFLYSLKAQYNADGVITAHHQDDLLETTAINILRGTGWRGLVAMQNNSVVLRPLLQLTKVEIYEYAAQNCLFWQEDSTNSSHSYLRNRVRAVFIENMTGQQRLELLSSIKSIENLSSEINQLIAKILQNLEVEGMINRQKYSILPVEVGREVLVSWLRGQGSRQIDSAVINRVDTFLRTGRPGSRTDIGSGTFVKLDKEFGQIVNSLQNNLI